MMRRTTIHATTRTTKMTGKRRLYSVRTRVVYIRTIKGSTKVATRNGR
jgi:hypothetical protein